MSYTSTPKYISHMINSMLGDIPSCANRSAIDGELVIPHVRIRNPLHNCHVLAYEEHYRNQRVLLGVQTQEDIDEINWRMRDDLAERLLKQDASDFKKFTDLYPGLASGITEQSTVTRQTLNKTWSKLDEEP